MATYNGTKYLRNQLESLSAQTRLPDELVVSDDGSSDSTLRILQDFADHAPFPVHILENQANVGYAGNFSRAVSATTGTLFFLCDQDNVWLPEKIEHMASYLNQHDRLHCLVCDAIIADENLKHIGVTKMGRVEYLGEPRTRHNVGCCFLGKL